MNYTNETNCTVSVPVAPSKPPMSEIMDDTSMALNEARIVLGKIWTHLTGETELSQTCDEPRCMIEAAEQTAMTAKCVLNAAVAISERLGI